MEKESRNTTIADTRNSNRDSRILWYRNDITDRQGYILIITQTDKLFDQEDHAMTPPLSLLILVAKTTLYDRRRSCFHAVPIDTVYARRFETRSPGSRRERDPVKIFLLLSGNEGFKLEIVIEVNVSVFRPDRFLRERDNTARFVNSI